MKKPVRQDRISATVHKPEADDSTENPATEDDGEDNKVESQEFDPPWMEHPSNDGVAIKVCVEVNDVELGYAV